MPQKIFYNAAILRVNFTKGILKSFFLIILSPQVLWEAVNIKLLLFFKVFAVTKKYFQTSILQIFEFFGNLFMIY